MERTMSTRSGAWRVAVNLVATVSVLVFILDFQTDLLQSLQKRFSGSSLYIIQDWSKQSHILEFREVRALLDSIKEATRIASDGSIYHFPAVERKEWDTRFPCQSRTELPTIYDGRKQERKLLPNLLWEEVLSEYSKLHRTCMQKVGNVSSYFLNKNKTVPGCKFLIGEGTNGLGNKLLVTVSAVLYAILTQRVLLVPVRTNLKSLLCEPFPGSTWIFDSDKFPMPGRGAANNSWTEDSEFLLSMNRQMKGEKIGPPSIYSLVVASGYGQWQPRQWFYCSTEQSLVSEVSWIYFSGCIYTIPKLFGSPAFGSTLKALFPDKMILTRMLRSSLLPSDIVWSRFKHLNHAYFTQSDRRVGIQLRFFRGSHYTKLKTQMNNRILDCVLKNRLLPNISSHFAKNISLVTKVFIASLYPDLHEHLSEFYVRSPTETGEDISLVQLTSHKVQTTGLEEDQQALVEVLLLSVSDDLLVTPVSTFGGLSQAYGGLTPWFIRYGEESQLSSCERAQTSDTCQQGGSPDYHCPLDPPRNVSEQPPLIKKCLPIDTDGGVQVITN